MNLIKKGNAETINGDDKKKPTLKKYSKSDLICDTNHSFWKYCDINPLIRTNSAKWSNILKEFVNLAIAIKLFECVDHVVALVLIGLKN